MPAKIRPAAIPVTLVGLAVIVIVVLASVIALSGAEAASNVSCGDRITANTTLHEDLVNCPNNGLIVRADDVTLDLNGHTIDGNGVPNPSCPSVTNFCDFGVAFSGHDGITVKHGTVRQFEGGVGAFRTRDTRLLGLSAPNNTFGDIGIANAARVLVRNCSGNRSTSAEGNGLGLFDSHHIRVLNSSFRHNVHAGIKPVGSTSSLIKGNLVARNGDEGLLMEGGKGFRVRANRFVGNGGGITLGPGSRNVITGNRISRGHDGIRIEKGHGNLVAGNVVVHARRAGIRLGISHPLFGGADNVVRGNLVRESRVDGFLVNEKDDHSLLKGNTATGAGDDGFDVGSPTATLTRNRGLGNADLGIAAVRGVADGGGNLARHNGDRRQCTHIACN